VPVIFSNPAGAPELACDECGCRWFDRMTGACYECGAPVAPEAQAEFRRALEAHAATRGAAVTAPRSGASPETA
jgi:ribosomal protein L37E